MKEIWKVYKDNRHYDNRGRLFGKIIEVSNFGRVRKNGIITNNKTISGKRIYIIVAELFVPNPENKPQVDHIDTNRNNNRADNLRWVTAKENMNNPLTKIHCSNGQLQYYIERPERKEEISKQHKNICYLTIEQRKQKSIEKSEDNRLRRWMNNGIDRVYPKQEEFDYYLNKGYVFGMKLI